MKKAAFLEALVVALAVIFILSSGPPTTRLPPYYVVGAQGVARMVVVSEAVAKDDEALWQITRTLHEAQIRGSAHHAVMVMFWTDRDALSSAERRRRKRRSRGRGFAE